MNTPSRPVVPYRLRAGILLAALLLGLTHLAAQTDNAPPSDPVIQLPDLKVTATSELPELESWRYVRVGNFDVLSNATDRTTQSLLADFATFTQAVSLVWPAPLKPIAGSSLILCGSGGKFDQFVPVGDKPSGAIVPSLFLRNREQIALIVDVESSRLTLDTANQTLGGVGAEEYEVDHYRQLYRQYVRYLLSQSEARPPIWVEEGLAQIVMDIELTDTSLIYGKIDSYKGAETGRETLTSEDSTDPSTSAVVGEQPFNVALRHTKLIPLDKFFALTAAAPETQNPLGNNLWAKQAYAFVHFCLFGEKHRYQQALSTFITRLAREPLSEALFRECFKMGYADMSRLLDGYILHTKHEYQKYPLQKGDQLTARSIVLRAATPAEIALFKGDALRLGGHHNQAVATYQTLPPRQEGGPLILSGLGLSEGALHHPDRARELLEKAVQRGTTRPSACVELARLRLATAAAQPANHDRLSAAQMSEILTPLFAARKLPPPLPETYELIAAAWGQSEVAPTVENLAVLDEGIRAFPRQSALLYQAAQLYHQAGADPMAVSIAKLGLRFASAPADKARFEQLLATFPASSP